MYLATRFGKPFLFIQIEKYWGQAPAIHTWLKIEFLNQVTAFSDPSSWLAHIAHPVITVLALALVPQVFHRFGWGYGVDSLLAVGVAAFSTKDFFGCGRYALAAFLCFAAAGGLLAEHTVLRTPALVLNATALVVMTSLFARAPICREQAPGIHRRLPVWPREKRPGWGQTHSPCGLFGTRMSATN